MDLATIGISAVLSAILFIVLEFTIILPLFSRIVKRTVDDMVKNDLIPSVSAFVDSKLTELTTNVTRSLFAKVKGMMGGRGKGFNSLMKKLSNPDIDIEDIDLDDYDPTTLDKLVAITSNLSPLLQVSIPRGAENGTQKNKENNNEEEELLRRQAQDYPSQRLQLERTG